MKIWSLSLVLAFALPCAAEEAVPDGYAQLVAAGKMLKPGENGYPSATEFNLPPAENLRRQRLAVERNAGALAAVREALKQPIKSPELDPNDLNLGAGASFRELARQFTQESAVRAADGDWVGALDSRLTTMEMGAACTRNGVIITMLVGVAIESIARKDIEKIVTHLDAPSLRAALVRMQAIDARRAPLQEIQETEKRYSLGVARNMFKEADYAQAKEALSKPGGWEQWGMSKREAEAFLATTPQNYVDQIAKEIDSSIARNQLPYQQTLKASKIQKSNPNVQWMTSIYEGPGFRFNYERNITAQRLLEGAMELRAIKLETGAYPTSFDAGTDSFGDGGSLVYRSMGESYQLYSVGPDGKDNGGMKFKSLIFDTETGTSKISKNLSKNSRGDILAPIL